MSSARGELRREYPPPAGNGRTNSGGRPSAAEIQLNKRIIAARDAESILSIVEAEHGEFSACNAATACNRLAKASGSSAKGLRFDDRRVQQLSTTVTRVAPSMKPQELANSLWGLATLGWQAGEGPMRDALEGAEVRVAPSMNAQDEN